MAPRRPPPDTSADPPSPSSLETVWPELEGRAREWWDKVKDDVGPATKRKSAFVRITPSVYAFCMPTVIDMATAERLQEIWKTVVGEGGPKLLILMDTVFVPELGE